VRGTISVPDPKPDVEKILSTDKSVKIRNVQIVPDKVIVEGILNVQIVYVAFKPAQSVHSMHGQINFTSFVDVKGALPGMKVDVSVVVEDISINRSTTCASEFDVAAVLEVSAKVSEVMDIDIVTQCPSGCSCDTEELTVDHVVGSNQRQVMISDQFDVPEEKPPVEKILDTDVMVMVTETRVLRNKVIVDGTATVTVVYVGMLPDQPVHSLRRTFKFSDFVEVPGAMQGMDVRFDVMIESADVTIVTGACDRLRADIVMKLTANVVEPRLVQAITELFDCTNVSPIFTTLRVDSQVGENTSQVVLKDTFATPDPKPDVEKILDTVAERVTITETKLLRDKVIMQPDQAVHAMHQNLPFRTFVEVMGAREDDKLDIRTNVEFITASPKGCDITIEAVLKATVRVTRPVESDVLTSVSPVTTTTPPGTTPCVPGTTFEYIVKSGDTLYTIGRTYGVTLNQMKAANPQLPDPNMIRPGMVVNVPCVAQG